jgi:hypothetical protein
MPRDPLQTNYEYAELLTINPANFSALSKWVGEIAGRVRKDPAGVLDCQASDETCVRAGVRAFALKAYRGDVDQARLDKLAAHVTTVAKAAGTGAAAGDLVEVVLNSPNFLFRAELETVGANNRLKAVPLLQAVTYTIADVPPDALKLDVANAHEYLKNGPTAGRTIDAVVRSEAARRKLARFIKAWLEVKEPGEFTISKETFKFDDKLARAMVEDTERFLERQLSKPEPTLKDITQVAEAHVSKPLEELYSTPAADPTGVKPTRLDPRRRLGIFSQPAVIASHSGPTDNRPMKRGVFWVRKVMCLDMGPPPPDFKVSDYPMEGKTERQKLESVTKAGNCLGCHQLIDPFAFLQENYDALGRWRNQENGEPVDASFNIDFLDEGPLKTSNPSDTVKALTSSMMFKQCFVRQMFRYYMGRNEEPSDDPVLRRMFFEFASGDRQPLLDLVWTLTSSDKMVRRQ